VSAVLAGIAILSGLLVLLFAVPIDLAFRLQGADPFSGHIAIRWMFGLLRHQIQLHDFSERQSPHHGTEADKAKVHAKREKRGAGAKVLAVLRKAAFRRRVYRLARDLVRAAHLHELDLRMRLGLGDPADTGRLWAFVGPLNAATQNLRNARVRIEPEFMDAVFEVEAQGRCRLIPLQFLALAVAFALSPASIRAWRTLWGDHA
jgi:hypothetical protein